MFKKKICLLGDFAVGKTSLVRRFVEGRFDDRYLSTIGVKISRRALVRPEGQLQLLIWDLAGSDSFGDSPSYLEGAAGAFIVCDLTRPDTLASLDRCARQVRAQNPRAGLVFLGNKADLTSERTITDAELQSVATAYHAPLRLCSAKTGEQVEAAFELLAEQLEQRP